VFGLTDGSAVMTTVATTPTKLVVSLAPSKLPNDNNYYYAIIVELQDAAGKPALAPNDIGVTLTSSNTLVGTVQSPITITRGSSYADAWFDTTLTPGTTTITAFSPPLTSGSAVMTTVTGGTAAKLAVILAPSKLVAIDRTYYNPVVIQLQDAAGNPAKMTWAIGITLTSSDMMVGTVPDILTLGGQNNVVETWFDSTIKPGQTTITASSPGLASGSGVMTTGRWYPQPPPFDLSDFPVPFVVSGVLDMTFVVGGTHPHGPFGWGAWTVDVLGGIAVAARLGHEAFKEVNVVQAVDDDIADYNATTQSVTIDWSKITTNTMACIGSGAVNLLSLYYNCTTPFKFVKIGWDVYIYSELSTLYYNSGWGYDHAVIALINEPHVGPVLLSYGITGKGSQTACLILQNYDLYPDLLQGKAVIVKWQDLNGNNMPDTSDQFTRIETWT